MVVVVIVVTLQQKLPGDVDKKQAADDEPAKKGEPAKKISGGLAGLFSKFFGK